MILWLPILLVRSCACERIVPLEYEQVILCAPSYVSLEDAHMSYFYLKSKSFY